MAQARCASSTAPSQVTGRIWRLGLILLTALHVLPLETDTFSLHSLFSFACQEVEVNPTGEIYPLLEPQ